LHGFQQLEAVQIGSGECHPFSAVDLELPGSLSITAGFSTIKLQDVITLVQGNIEVELGGFSSLPDISSSLLHNLTVHHRDTAQTEICWGSEGPFGIVVSIGESDSIVESDVLVGSSSTAQSTVGDLGHSWDEFLTVSFGSLGIGNSLSELREIFSNVGLVLSGSHEDGGILKWESWHALVRFGLILDSHFHDIGTDTNLLLPFLVATSGFWS